MKRGHFAHLTFTKYGRSRMLSLEDAPAELLEKGGWAIRPEVLTRMRYRACGRRGRPDMRFG